MSKSLLEELPLIVKSVAIVKSLPALNELKEGRNA
jgi:hypothetical protein